LCFVGPIADKVNDLFDKSIASLEDELAQIKTTSRKYKAVADASITLLVNNLEARAAALVEQLDRRRPTVAISDRVTFNAQANDILLELEKSLNMHLVKKRD